MARAISRAGGTAIGITAPSPPSSPPPPARWATARRLQSLPRSVTLGTNPPGSVFYTLGSGLAKAVAGGPFEVTLQPHAGTSTFLPLLDSGEMEFGVVNAVDMALAHRGPTFKIGGRNPFPHAPNLRLVMRGSPLLVGLLVRKDSPIRNVHDVKGKRMTGEYPAHLAVWYNMFGHLASAGLTWSDVQVVPVPAVNDGVDALVQGRADVTEARFAKANLEGANFRGATGVARIRGLDQARNRDKAIFDEK